jgi:hypothetical protein
VLWRRAGPEDCRGEVRLLRLDVTIAKPRSDISGHVEAHCSSMWSLAMFGSKWLPRFKCFEFLNQGPSGRCVLETSVMPLQSFVLNVWSLTSVEVPRCVFSDVLGHVEARCSSMLPFAMFGSKKLPRVHCLADPRSS